MLLASSAAAEAKTGSIYDVTFAKGFEKLTFTGDADSNCAQFNVCGVEGTVTYTLSGKPKGKIYLTRSRSGKVRASGSYRTAGTTSSTVETPGEACSGGRTHARDVFSMFSSGPRNNSLRLAYHDAATTDYLATECKGLTEADVRAAGALPEGIFQANGFFKGEKPSFGLSGGTPFKAKGFNATVEWNLRYKAKARFCSPNCKLPAGTP
jgi:hypothetical protein